MFKKTKLCIVAGYKHAKACHSCNLARHSEGYCLSSHICTCYANNIFIKHQIDGNIFKVFIFQCFFKFKISAAFNCNFQLICYCRLYGPGFLCIICFCDKIVDLAYNLCVFLQYMTIFLY